MGINYRRATLKKQEAVLDAALAEIAFDVGKELFFVVRYKEFEYVPPISRGAESWASITNTTPTAQPYSELRMKTEAFVARKRKTKNGPRTVFTASGESIVRPPDRFDRLMGRVIAKGRALKAFEKRLVDMGMWEAVMYRPVDPLVCEKCGTVVKLATGIGEFCPNKECDNVDGPCVRRSVFIAALPRGDDKQ